MISLIQISLYLQKNIMKRIIYFTLSLCFCSLIYGQAYRPITIADVDYVTINSTNGISVDSIIYGKDGYYSVYLKNNNYNNSGERNTYTFQWYLSYKGKRVSDHFDAALKCREQKYIKVLCWPDEVPKGNEKYVTVQLGKEKNRRDDSR